MSENVDSKNHNVDQSSLDQLYRMDREMDHIKTQLLECETEYEQTEIEIYNFDQLTNKGTYVLKNVEREYNNLNDELGVIHRNYMKCVEKANSTNGTIQQTIDSLTLQRDKLKKELDGLKKTADENNEKLMEIEKMITIQEKKNIALTRKLKRIVKNVHIPSNLKDKVNMILIDPRLTNVRNSNQSTEQ